MRCLFLHKYFDNEQPVTLLITLQGTELTITDKDSGVVLGSLTWQNNILTGDASFLPDLVIFEIVRKLLVATTRVEPVYVDQPVEEQEQEEGYSELPPM
jgi:hypothetical protein